MDVFIAQAVEWISSRSALEVYTLFALIAYAENIVPPIPGDVLVAFGGYLAAEGILDPFFILGITTVASVLGFMSAYGFGSWWGERLIDPESTLWIKKVINMGVFERGRRWMQTWGQWVVLSNRFLAGTRSVIALTAGLSHTPVVPTILSSTISSLIWNSILIGFGWVVKENWETIGGYLNTYGVVVIVVIALFFMTRYIFSKLSD
jgi:membrane protein DedA with SNARE-associated domain